MPTYKLNVSREDMPLLWVLRDVLKRPAPDVAAASKPATPAP